MILAKYVYMFYINNGNGDDDDLIIILIIICVEVQYPMFKKILVQWTTGITTFL